MKTEDIVSAIEGYDRLTHAVVSALKSDKTLIDEADRWLPSLWASDIASLDVNLSDQTLIGHGMVWTMQTGGSTEIVGFTIPLDTLRKFL